MSSGAQTARLTQLRPPAAALYRDQCIEREIAALCVVEKTVFAGRYGAAAQEEAALKALHQRAEALLLGARPTQLVEKGVVRTPDIARAADRLQQTRRRRTA